MIELLDIHFIGKGNLQECYKHPNSETLCVKKNIKRIEETRIANELKYYKKISKKTFSKNDYAFFAKFHGSETSNLGEVYIFDLVKDADNSVSKTLEYYLLNPHPYIDFDVLKKAFDRLISLMIKYKIVASDIKAANICCKILKSGSVELVLIDGAGHRDFIPLANWFSFFTKQKMKRRLRKRFLDDLNIQKKYLESIQ